MYEVFDWRMTISRSASVISPPSTPRYVVYPSVPLANDAQCITPSSSQVTGLPAHEPAVTPPAFASEPPFPEAAAPSGAPEAVGGEPEGLLEHASDKAASDRSAATQRVLEVLVGPVRTTPYRRLLAETPHRDFVLVEAEAADGRRISLVRGSPVLCQR